MGIPETVLTASSRVTLGDFLVENTGFEFDLEEYLLSTKAERFLNERMALYSAASLDPVVGAEEVILRSVRAEYAATVAAYKDYGRAKRIDQFPTISKTLIRADPTRFLNREYSEEHLWRKLTTGSSGPPITVWYSPEFYFDLLLLSVRKIALGAGLENLGARPYFCLCISDNRSLTDAVFVDPSGAVGLCLQVVVDEQCPPTFDRALSLIQALSPECISSKPSIFEMLVDISSQSRSPVSGPCLWVSSGAFLSASLRSEMEERFGGKVVNAYAMTEFGLVASECRAGSLHVDTSAVQVEILADNGYPAARGEPGEIVISNVTNRAMPLVRYRTGDTGALVPSSCNCGNIAPRLSSFVGRMISCFKLRSGRLFSPTYFNDLFSRFPSLIEFQMTQHDVGYFEVLVEFRDGADKSSELEKLNKYIRSAIPDQPEVRTALNVFRHDSKFQRFRTAL